MHNTTYNSYGNEFRTVSQSAGISVNDSTSYRDDRTRVSDGSYSRIEQGYRNMDKILANERMPRGEMLEMLQNEFSEV
jgi:hypothetical protein